MPRYLLELRDHDGRIETADYDSHDHIYSVGDDFERLEDGRRWRVEKITDDAPEPLLGKLICVPAEGGSDA